MIPALDPAQESDFQLYRNSGCIKIWILKKRIIILIIEVLRLLPWIRIWSHIFSLLEIPDPDSDPLKVES